MKKKFLPVFFIVVFSIIQPVVVNCQSTANFENYLEKLPGHLMPDNTTPQKYLMTAEYINKDIYGEIGSKIKVTGEYTRGLENGYVRWNNVFISKSQSEFYSDGIKQEYMENIKYVPSSEMLEESSFVKFQSHPDNVFSRNLIWDMMAIEMYAWNYVDSLSPNKTYIISDFHGSFSMANIGTYTHSKNELNWIGISRMNNELCAIIEYRALDNKLELNTNEFQSKGSESYWGKTWLSLKSGQIEYAEMYSNTIQEMEIQGIPGKILANTIRVLRLDRIR
ncbi:MAG: hypothetical protein JXJ22_13075 [Bacteroidales bacterium]|nr:hypothetical protein [Bacteroidales bacterium]